MRSRSALTDGKGHGMTDCEAVGRIVKGIGGFYYVDIGDALIACRARGKFRKLGISPMVGDRARFSSPDGENGYLLELLPRKNALIRPPIANLDVLVIVASQAPPVTDLFLIDRVSAVAHAMGIEVVIAVNKCDMDAGDQIIETYRAVGFPTLRVSGRTGEGVSELLEILRGKLSAFTGNSGVGKSTILNAIAPEFALATGALNDKIGRGRHTTRHVEIFKIGAETWIADTPGFSSFDTERMELIAPEGLERAFPEFEPYREQCEFIGCAHCNDRGCAVCAAAQEGKIPPSRLESYQKLYENLRERKPWEKRV